MQTIPAALLGICKETCQNTKETHQHTQRTNQHTREKHQDTKVPAALFVIFLDFDLDFDLGHTRDVSTRKKDSSPHKREQSTNLRRFLASFTTPNSDPSCVAVFCNVLQGVAGCCRVLRCVAAFCSVYLRRSWASFTASNSDSSSSLPCLGIIFQTLPSKTHVLALAWYTCVCVRVCTTERESVCVRGRTRMC